MTKQVRINVAEVPKMVAQIEALTAENERLQEALQKVADIDRYWRTVSRQSLATGDTHYDDVLELGQFAKIARQALAGKDEK